MAGWHHWLDGRESEWTPGVGDGQGGLACCDSWCRQESDTTERLNWTELNMTLFSKQSTRNPRSLLLPCLGLSAINRASFLDMLLLQLPGALHSDGPRALINGLLIHSCLEILNHFWTRDSGFHFSFDLTNGWSWPLTSYFSEFQKRQQRSSVWSSESQQSWLETESSTFTLTSVILNQGKFAP